MGINRIHDTSNYPTVGSSTDYNIGALDNNTNNQVVGASPDQSNYSRSSFTLVDSRGGQADTKFSGDGFSLLFGPPPMNNKGGDGFERF